MQCSTSKEAEFMLRTDVEIHLEIGVRPFFSSSGSNTGSYLSESCFPLRLHMTADML